MESIINSVKMMQVIGMKTIEKNEKLLLDNAYNTIFKGSRIDKKIFILF